MKKILFIFLTLIIVLASYIAFELFSITKKEKKEETAKILLDSNCNLQKSDCPFLMEDERGQISITPRPFYLNTRIQVEVLFKTARERKLTSYIEGLDMDMKTGYVNHDLHSLDQKKYKSKFLLPTCTKDYMPWRLSIVIEDKKKTKVNLYKFLAEKK